MGENAGAGDVRRLHGIRISLALAEEKLDELVREVRMRSSVTAALRVAEMILPLIASVDTTVLW